MALETFIDNYNASHDLSLYCPTILENGPHSIDDLLLEAKDESDLPDIWVANSFHTSFAQPFRKKFIESGIYEGVTKKEWLNLLPQPFRKMADQQNTGFLAFGSWGIVVDTSVTESEHYPKYWTDLADDAFKGKIGIHGCSGHATGAALLMILKERVGVDAIAKFSANLGQIAHFSKLIKAIDSSEPQRTRFIVMPSAAIQQIPSKKQIAQLELRDGPILTPIMLFVKRSRRHLVADVLSFLWSDEFRDVLLKGNILMPDQLNWTEPHTIPDLEQIAQRDFNELSMELDAEFMKGLPDNLKV